MRDLSRYPLRKTSLAAKEPDALPDLISAARIALMWPLTVQAWQFKEPALR